MPASMHQRQLADSVIPVQLGADSWICTESSRQEYKTRCASGAQAVSHLSFQATRRCRSMLTGPHRDTFLSVPKMPSSAYVMPMS